MILTKVSIFEKTGFSRNLFNKFSFSLKGNVRQQSLIFIQISGWVINLKILNLGLYCTVVHALNE